MNSLNDLRQLIVKASENQLFELSKVINTEIYSRQTNGKLDNFFQPDQIVSYCDDDGCLFVGKIAKEEEFHQFGDALFLKDIDPKTNKQIFATAPNGQLVIRGNPLVNSSQLFKYAIDEEVVDVL